MNFGQGFVEKLNILLTADPELPVPPQRYGGIERVVDMLAHELVSQGHDVTLLAHADSSSAGRLVPWRGRSSLSISDSFLNAARLARVVATGRFDIIHSFSRIAYMLPALPFSIPKLMTYQRAISRRSILWGHRLSRGSLWFTAISQWMIGHVQDCGTWRVIFNGVPLSKYAFSADPGPSAPLVFLGRIEEIKGPHLAIEVAKLAGRSLVLAGNVPPEHREWFKREVAPKVDGRQIRYVGPVDDRQKNLLLGTACALMMPVLWEEPFGIVMAEAMACGTPVIGFARGAVPEVVEHGVTGFVEAELDDMVAAVQNIGKIDRSACRSRVEQLFSDTAITREYIAVYREMIAARRGNTAA